MIYPTFIKKKRFEEGGSEVLPSKNRPFLLKERATERAREPEEETPARQRIPDKREGRPQNRPGGYDPYYRGTPTQPIQKNDPLKEALRGPAISDAQGLERAYSSPNGVYTYGDTEFVAGTRGALWEKDWLQNLQHLGIPFLTEGKPNTQSLDKFKAADTAYQSNQGVKRFVGHSQGGAVALEMGKKYPGVTGRVYGTPYVDPFGKEAAKDFLNDQRNYRNQLYGDKWYNQPAKFVDNKLQDLVEKEVGLSDVKGVKDSGFERYANRGDPVAVFDSSATRETHPDPWSHKSFTHDYHNLAGDKFTSNPTNAYGWENPDGTVSLRE